jgi:DNA-binding IclR family transcriptional regulator
MKNDSPSTSVDRALRILEAVASRDGGLSNSQIHRLLHIPKSSASYILRTLEQRGYVRREPSTAKYRLGLQVLSLSRGVVSGLGVRDLALPLLDSLVEHTRLTAHLAVLDHGRAVYIEKVDAPGFIKMDIWVGRHMDLHCTSVGKALAAHLPKSNLEAVIHQHGLPKRGPKTITTVARFLSELDKVRQQGYALDDEENNAGVRCVAAAVLDSAGEAQAAIGVSGTTTQIGEDALPKIAELVREAARKLSKRLGNISQPHLAI